MLFSLLNLKQVVGIVDRLVNHRAHIALISSIPRRPCLVKPEHFQEGAASFLAASISISHQKVHVVIEFHAWCPVIVSSSEHLILSLHLLFEFLDKLLLQRELCLHVGYF